MFFEKIGYSLLSEFVALRRFDFEKVSLLFKQLSETYLAKKV